MTRFNRIHTEGESNNKNGQAILTHQWRTTPAPKVIGVLWGTLLAQGARPPGTLGVHCIT